MNGFYDFLFGYKSFNFGKTDELPDFQSLNKIQFIHIQILKIDERAGFQFQVRFTFQFQRTRKRKAVNFTFIAEIIFREPLPEFQLLWRQNRRIIQNIDNGFWNKSFGYIGMKFFYDSGIDFFTAKRHQYPHPDLDYRNEFLWYRIRKGSFQVERQNDLGKIQNRAAINRTYKSSKINAEHNPGINRSQLRCLNCAGNYGNAKRNSSDFSKLRYYQLSNCKLIAQTFRFRFSGV